MNEQTNGLSNHEQDEIIDLEEFSQTGKKPPAGKKYRVRIDNDTYVFTQEKVSGKELLEATGKQPVECFWLYQKLKGGDFEKIDLPEEVDLTRPGIEKFAVKPTEVFHYRVDDEPETTDQKILTPNQILEAAGIKPVSDYYLIQIHSDGRQESYKDNPNQKITMQCPEMKFISAYRGETGVS